MLRQIISSALTTSISANTSSPTPLKLFMTREIPWKKRRWCRFTTRSKPSNKWRVKIPKKKQASRCSCTISQRTSQITNLKRPQLNCRLKCQSARQLWKHICRIPKTTKLLTSNWFHVPSCLQVINRLERGSTTNKKKRIIIVRKKCSTGTSRLFSKQVVDVWLSQWTKQSTSTTPF